MDSTQRHHSIYVGYNRIPGYIHNMPTTLPQSSSTSNVVMRCPQAHHISPPRCSVSYMNQTIFSLFPARFYHPIRGRFSEQYGALYPIGRVSSIRGQCVRQTVKAFIPTSVTHIQNVVQHQTPTLTEMHMRNLDAGNFEDQFDLRSLAFKLNEKKSADLTPDGICSTVVNEMNNLKLSHPNELMCSYFNGPFDVPAESAHIFNDTVCEAGPTLDPELDTHFTRQQLEVQLEKYNDDLLFYLFYNFVQEQLQVSAAGRLFEKGWRFHLEWKVWISRDPNSVYTPISGPEINYLIECGIYNWFDIYTWKIQQTELVCDFSKLDYSLAFISKTTDTLLKPEDLRTL